jgi:protein-disulfide isomerase
VLGTEPEIVANYIEPGQVRLVFWPMLDHGQASLNAHAAADCVGRQDATAFWQIHDQFFADQNDLWNAGRDYFVDAAANVGVDQAAFESCYDSGDAHETVTALDAVRRERGIFSRPSFDINGQLLVGAQPYSVFVDYFETLLAQ